MSKHDQRPQNDPNSEEEVLAKIEELRNSPYVQSIRPLTDLVLDRVVRSTLSGHSGFALLFDDESWVIAYLSHQGLLWRHGSGAPDTNALALMSEPGFADAAPPIPEDRPYADEPCEIAREVAQAHGKRVTGLAFGANSFNFCFPDGRELDASVVTTSDGRPGLRVFWEQW